MLVDRNRARVEQRPEYTIRKGKHELQQPEQAQAQPQRPPMPRPSWWPESEPWQLPQQGQQAQLTQQMPWDVYGPGWQQALSLPYWPRAAMRGRAYGPWM